MLGIVKPNKVFSKIDTQHICTKHGIRGVSTQLNGRLLETCKQCRAEKAQNPEWLKEEKIRQIQEKEERAVRALNRRVVELAQQFPRHRAYRWDDLARLNPEVTQAISQYYQKDKKRGYAFYGGVGTGKTTASYLLAKKYLEKSGVRECLRIKSATIYRQSFLPGNQLMDNLKKVKLLIIDDFGWEGVKTDYVKVLFYELIDYRSEERSDLITIITTNLRRENLAHYLEPTRLSAYFHLIEFTKQIRGII